MTSELIASQKDILFSLKRTLIYNLSLITVLVLTSLCYVNANNSIDSLKAVIDSDLPGGKRLIALTELIDQLKNIDFHQTEEFALRGIDEAKKLQLDGLEAEIRRLAGVNYWLHGQYKKAEPQLLNARNIFVLLNDSTSMAQVDNTLGLLHYYQAEYDTAIYFLSKALKRYEFIRDSAQIARVANNLGLVYGTKGDFVSSTDYLIKSIKYKVLYTSLRDRDGIPSQLSGLQHNKFFSDQPMKQAHKKISQVSQSGDPYKLANAYSECGKFFQIRRIADSANFYFRKALNVYQLLGSGKRVALELRELARTHVQNGECDSARFYLLQSIPLLRNGAVLATLTDALGNLYEISMTKGLYDDALKFAGQSLQLADTINHRASKSLILRYIGAAFEAQGKYDNALNYFEKSYEMASEIDSYGQIQDAALKLYQLHKTLNHPDKALKYHEEWVEMTNVINLAMADRASKEFQAKYENEKHVDEIGRLGFENLNSEKLLSTQRIAIILTWLLILLVFIFGLIFYSRYRKIHTLKKNLDIQNELLIVRSDENETLLSEIHHRVKNNLQMITSLLNMQNRRVEDGKSKELLEMTNSRVRSIGLIHEHLYQSEQFSSINVKKYVTDLIAMLVNSLHHGNSIDLQIDAADKETSIDNILPIGLIINELLTNSIKYAFIDHPSPRLDFQMKQQEDILKMKFSDNGLKEASIEKGFGWTIIESTLDGVKGKASTFYKGGLHVDIEIKDYLLA